MSKLRTDLPAAPRHPNQGRDSLSERSDLSTWGRRQGCPHKPDQAKPRIARRASPYLGTSRYAAKAFPFGRSIVLQTDVNTVAAILLCLLMAAHMANGADAPAPSAFAKAGALYDAGNFSEAAATYQREVHAGHYSANLFFDLGNTYYRLGDLGRAVINYQRALLLEPGHAEARANLAYVRGKTATRMVPPADPSGQLRAALETSDVNVYAILAAVSGWLAVFGVCLGVLTRRRRLAGWLMVGMMLPVFASCTAVLLWLGQGRKSPERAIILKDQTPAHYAPADSAKVITKLPVGDEVRVLSERGAWVYAQLPDGARAWVLADTVERIIPAGFLPQGSMK